MKILLRVALNTHNTYHYKKLIKTDYIVNYTCNNGFGYGV